MKQYFPAVILSTAFVLLLLFLNTRNSLNFTENLPLSITPTAIPTEAKWQTYKDEVNKFEISFPQEWAIEKQNDGDISVGRVQKGVHLADILIDLNNDKKITLPIQNWIVKNSQTNKFEREIAINNIQMTEFIDSSWFVDRFVYAFSNGKKIISISYDDSDQTSRKINDQILSTFKFTDQKQSTIYTNTKHGYQLDTGAKLFGFNLKADSDSAYWDNEKNGAPLGLSKNGFWLNIAINNDPTALVLYQNLVNSKVGETGEINHASLTKISNLNTSGIKGAIFSTKPPKNFASESAYAYEAIWIKDNKAYTLVLASQIESTRNSHKGDFNKILSTFKFNTTNFDGIYTKKNGDNIHITSTNNIIKIIGDATYPYSSDGVNVGHIEGTLNIINNKAIYNEGNCKISLTFSLNKIDVSELSSSGTCGGHNVNFSGEYSKK